MSIQIAGHHRLQLGSVAAAEEEPAQRQPFQGWLRRLPKHSQAHQHHEQDGCQHPKESGKVAEEEGLQRESTSRQD